jgi:serine/threonine protein kinase
MADQYGKWRVLKSIGEGGQNHVFLVVDTTGMDAGNYALKRLKNTGRVERFKREIEARRNINIAGVPQIFDAALADKPYLVETYYEAGNMAANRHLFEGDLLKTLKYFAQICGVIADAHALDNPVVHRDIKPQNILWDQSADCFVVTDFGICLIIDEKAGQRFTLLDEQVGPRNFIAPELEKGGASAVTPQADVYSLGKLLYWMLSGKELFREEYRTEEFDLVHKTGNRHLERVNRILDRCVVKEPQQRFGSAGILRRELDNIISLVERRKNVITFGVYQKCMYCGLGNYIPVATWDPSLEGKRPNNYIASKEEFEKYGYRLEQRVVTKWHLTCCDFCGNVQLFVRSADNESWEKASYRAPDRAID